MKNILQNILALFARRTIYKYAPLVIGITGSVGKTSTREAIFAVLKNKYKVRTSEKNYNNEIGLPLTVLGTAHHGKNIFRWCSSLVRATLPQREYPEILILEYGVDHPGDMEYLLSIAKPNMAVVTAIGDIPVHVEFFGEPEEVIKEKARLAEAVPQGGLIILNQDDYAVLSMRDNAKGKVTTFGFEEHAEVKIINFQFSTSKDEKLRDVPDGVSFKIEHKGHVVPFRIHGAFGEPQAYAVAAAVSVGISLGINLVEISESMQSYIPPPGRMRLIKGIKGSLILDDTYNAAPEAMRAALETLKALPGSRKIAVLGDMLEIGKYAEQAHRAIVDQVGEFVDILFAVGPRAKFVAEEATSTGIKQTAKFDDSVSAGKALDPLIRPGDLILIKGSQSMRMEKAVEEIMAEPGRAKELLVRQEEYWKNS